MPHYKIFAQLTGMGGPLNPTVPFTVARYSNHSLLGLDQTSATAQAAALGDPTLAVPVVSNNVGPGADGNLAYPYPCGLWQWNGGAWQHLSAPGTIGQLETMLAPGDTLHWFIFI